MDESPSEKRLAENEVLFRKLNEQVSTGIEETNRLAEEDNQPEYAISLSGNSSTLRFFCECSDENCHQRIPIQFEEYKRIHLQRDCFVVAPSHEEVIRRKPGYSVVKKHIDPPQSSDTLHPTAIDND